MLAGVVLGGWQMARAAMKADAMRKAKSGDAKFLEAKIATARFFGDHVLAQAPGMASSIVEGAGSVLAMPEAREELLEAAGEAMRTSANQLIPIAKMTPHRVMRKLYEQLIAYSWAYADAIPTYTPPDENLALVTNSAANAITSICAAIDFGSAPSRSANSFKNASHSSGRSSMRRRRGGIFTVSTFRR